MRTLTTQFRNSLEASASDELLLAFLTVTHAGLEDPIRLVNDVVDYQWQGFRYIGFPFDITLISDGDKAPSARLRLQNVDRIIGRAALALASSPRVQLDVLAGSDFAAPVERLRQSIGTPIVEYSAPLLRLRNVRGDSNAIEGELWSWDLSQEPWPKLRTTRDLTPALYR